MQRLLGWWRLPSRSSSSITSTANPTARALRRLARRRAPGQVLLEGPRVVTEAVTCGVELELLAVREGVDFDVPVRQRLVLATHVFDAVSSTVTPQGVLAIGRYSEVPVKQAQQAAQRACWPLVVLDGIQDPGNVGTICRTAVAAGAPAVVILEDSADPLGAKAVRASAGNVFRLQIARGGWGDLERLEGYGAVASGGIAPEAMDLGRAHLLALGGEVRGLRRLDLQPVTIPLAAGVESLNVAAAAAVLLFEVRRKIA
jgi:TrmH family RNA methyltransferase